MNGYCAPDAHIWVPDGRFYSWLRCQACGASAVCKACHGRGADIPSLPDVFCAPHAPYAEDYRTRLFSGPVLGRRIRGLAQTAHGYADGWARCPEGWRLRLVVVDFEVWLHRALKGD